jgi:hypothetical protein
MSLSADAPRKLVIAINRTDVAPGEPGDLQQFQDLAPGESTVITVHERSLISIAEQTPALEPSSCPA